MNKFLPRWPLTSGDFQSIYPTLLRKVNSPIFLRETLELSDGDFLHLDWFERANNSLVIITHGLEGSSKSKYVIGMSGHLSELGFDILAWNMRGCSGEANRKFSWYHSGQSEDLRSVVQHVNSSRKYKQIYLIGFSVGGNITLKYLGEEGEAARNVIKAAAVASVPVDLRSSAFQLAKLRNRIYMEYLLRPLRRRILEKEQRFPGMLDISGLNRIRTFHEFDRRFTAPMHGFSSVDEYWDKASSLPWLVKIKVPVLLVNAKDDPFLPPECFPHVNNPNLTMEYTEYGGHVGFMQSFLCKTTWFEKRVSEWVAAKA